MKTFKKVHVNVLNNRRVKCELTLQTSQIIAFTMRLSYNQSYNVSILHKYLYKKSFQRDGRLVIVDQKCIRTNVSKKCLDMFKSKQSKFFITVNALL